MNGVGLRQVVKILGATAEVLFGVSGMSECKLPSLVQTDGLAYILSLNSKHLERECK